MRIARHDENTLILKPTDALILLVLGVLIMCASPFLLLLAPGGGGPRGEGLLAGGIVGVIFLLLALPEHFTQWKFDRQEGTLSYHRLTLTGMKVDSYALQDIAKAQVTQGMIRRRMTGFGVELVTRDEQTIPLIRWKDVNRSSKERLVATIQEFLQPRQP